jgi:hypothetical protein
MSKKRTSDFYKNLVPFFIKAYPNIAKNEAQTLGQCAFEYFDSLLVIDNFVDGEVDITKHPQKLFEAIELHEKSIRNLAFLIPQQNDFWQHFDSLKKRYTQTVFYEKDLSAKKTDFTEITFEDLAFGKSVICCGIVYGLQALCKKPAPVNDLNDIIKHIHIAFQYLDDISDFKQDITQNQWTYPQYIVSEYAKTNGLGLDDTGKYKYLFLSGTAQQMVQKAVEHYKKASELSRRIGLTDLDTFINQEQVSALFYSNEVQLLIDKTKIKAQKSQHIVAGNIDIKQTIANATKYLMTNAKQGFWEDFMTSAGHGKTWISSYVGLMLADNEAYKPFLETVLTNISAQGSYNDGMSQDADSSTFLMGLHHKITGQIPENLLNSWLSFQNNDGGWVTYNDEAPLRQILDLDNDISVEGWFMAHGCVSAAAAYISADIPALAEVYNKTCKYLIDLVLDNKLSAYWWTSDIYAYTFTLFSLSKDNNIKACSKLINSIIDSQHSAGYWVNPINNIPNAYYTALALKAMLSFEPEKQKTKIEAAAKWLLTNQMTDGSWQTDRILRIPATNVTNPSTVSRWRKSSFGVNALSDDHNRIFTTSTVINALNCYAKL